MSLDENDFVSSLPTTFLPGDIYSANLYVDIAPDAALTDYTVIYSILGVHDTSGVDFSVTSHCAGHGEFYSSGAILFASAWLRIRRNPAASETSPQAKQPLTHSVCLSEAVLCREVKRADGKYFPSALFHCDMIRAFANAIMRIDAGRCAFLRVVHSYFARRAGASTLPTSGVSTFPPAAVSFNVALRTPSGAEEASSTSTKSAA